MEKRRFTRFEFVSKCTVIKATQKSEIEAKILNISSGGMFVSCPTGSLEIDEKIVIIFIVEKDGVSNELEFKCTVVRLDDDGVGVELTPNDTECYTNFIDILLMSDDDQSKIKSKIFNSDHYKKHWKGRGVHSNQ